MYSVVHSSLRANIQAYKRKQRKRKAVRNLYIHCLQIFPNKIHLLKRLNILKMNLLNRVLSNSKIICGVVHNLRIKPYPCQFITNGDFKMQQYKFSTGNTFVCRNKNNDGILKTIVSKIPFINLEKNRLKVTGFLLYESIADYIPYEEFFTKFSLPDTFYSWFVVTELHVWMLLVRAMAEGEDGRYARNAIVQALWADVNTRAKKLGAANPSGTRMQIDELSQQFQATLVAYDEGLLTNDKILANALWRRFFQQHCENSENLEFLVKYIRKQVKLLDDLSKDELLEKRHISWIPLNKNT